MYDKDAVGVATFYTVTFPDSRVIAIYNKKVRVTKKR